MPRALPPLTWFRSFEAAARHLSFTAAASELGLTQSAISQQVRALETRLGVQLFTRKPRGLALTDDGRKLLPNVDRAIQNLAAAAGQFDAGPTSNLLTVATSVSIAQWVIQPHLRHFLAEHPGLRVRIISMLWSDDFTSTLADVEIRFGSQVQVGQGATALGQDGLIIVSKNGDLDDLTNLPLIEAVGLSSDWTDWNAQTQMSNPPNPQIFVDSHGAALDMAAHGGGVALTSALLAQTALNSGRVKQIGTTKIPCAESYFLAVAPDNPKAASFADWLHALLHDADSKQ